MNTRPFIILIILIGGCKAAIAPTPPKRISPNTQAKSAPTIAVRADAPDWLKEAVAASARTFRNECLDRIPLDVLETGLHEDPNGRKNFNLLQECLLASATAADVARTAVYTEARETCVRERSQCCFTHATADFIFERKERERCDVDCAEQLHVSSKMLGRRECHPMIIDEPPSTNRHLLIGRSADARRLWKPFSRAARSTSRRVHYAKIYQLSTSATTAPASARIEMDDSRLPFSSAFDSFVRTTLAFLVPFPSQRCALTVKSDVE
jgi:hypothetical protein